MVMMVVVVVAVGCNRAVDLRFNGFVRHGCARNGRAIDQSINSKMNVLLKAAVVVALGMIMTTSVSQGARGGGEASEALSYR